MASQIRSFGFDHRSYRRRILGRRGDQATFGGIGARSKRNREFSGTASRLGFQSAVAFSSSFECELYRRFLYRLAFSTFYRSFVCRGRISFAPGGFWQIRRLQHGRNRKTSKDEFRHNSTRSKGGKRLSKISAAVRLGRRIRSFLRISTQTGASGLSPNDISGATRPYS